MLIEFISQRTKLGEGYLQYFARTATKRYKVYQIPKRTGGHRTIEHPAKPLKALQRIVIKKIVNGLPVHTKATAYRRGRSIRDNAIVHAALPFTMRVDFKDFFHSFRSENIRMFACEVIKIHFELTEADVEFIVGISVRNGALAVGAPISPSLTNCLMFSFDEEMSDFCKHSAFVYTRYADDIFVWSREAGKLHLALSKIKELAANFRYAELSINDEKTRFLSRRYRRQITGLIVTPEGQLSIGRSKERELRSLVYMASDGALDIERRGYLAGWLAYVKSCDPDYYAMLLRRYGPLVTYLLP